MSWNYNINLLIYRRCWIGLYTGVKILFIYFFFFGANEIAAFDGLNLFS
jgi:hypothetical protein